MEPTQEPRMVGLIYVECKAPVELFEREWEYMSPDVQDWYLEHDLACEGTGQITTCCIGCPFVKLGTEE